MAEHERPGRDLGRERINAISGGSVSPNPGPSWTEIGSGDFNGDRHAGPSWRAIGTGDFNGDGSSDIQWQNANGQAAIWEMNGPNVIAGGSVGANPGSSWRTIA
jgi:hypothetical protein